jgi:hypothetical protein
VRLSLKFSKGACVRARLPRVLFPLDRVRTAFRIFIVSFKEHANTTSPFQPALQFLNVVIWFLMLTETCTLEYSLPFCLESLCRKNSTFVCSCSLDGPLIT